MPILLEISMTIVYPDLKPEYNGEIKDSKFVLSRRNTGFKFVSAYKNSYY